MSSGWGKRQQDWMFANWCWGKYSGLIAQMKLDGGAAISAVGPAALAQCSFLAKTRAFAVAVSGLSGATRAALAAAIPDKLAWDNAWNDTHFHFICNEGSPGIGPHCFEWTDEEDVPPKGNVEAFATALAWCYWPLVENISTFQSGSFTTPGYVDPYYTHMVIARAWDVVARRQYSKLATDAAAVYAPWESTIPYASL